MLVACPECQLQVSDKALACPHCGFPLQTQQETTSILKPRKRNKRRRLPNGFGQITEIKNRNLRRPFRAMVTIAKQMRENLSVNCSNRRPILKPITTHTRHCSITTRIHLTLINPLPCRLFMTNGWSPTPKSMQWKCHNDPKCLEICSLHL